MMKKWYACLFCLLFTAGILAGCTEKPAVIGDSFPGSTTQTPDKSAGATANTGKVGADPYETLWAKIDGSTATIPLSEAIAADRLGIAAEEASSRITHNTTNYAYTNLIDKKADLIFVTYPSEDEFAYAKEKGVELEVVPAVKDAFVFLVNVENPVKSITLEQARDIYAGKITNWKEVGGSDEKIIAYQRPENSGSQTLFLKLVMKGTKPMEPPVDWVQAEMGGLVDVVSSYDNGPASIGYSVFYYVNDMYGNDRFRLLGIDGVVPDKRTIARGEYPLESAYYAVLRKDTPADDPARKLLAWLLTDEGQKVAQNAGYVPLREIK